MNCSLTTTTVALRATDRSNTATMTTTRSRTRTRMAPITSSKVILMASTTLVMLLWTLRMLSIRSLMSKIRRKKKKGSKLSTRKLEITVKIIMHFRTRIIFKINRRFKVILLILIKFSIKIQHSSLRIKKIFHSKNYHIWINWN